jgi:aspartyl-tRNA(Asn)/glutamyl-tRNA(Gln) amidotransferase subunit A
MLLTEIDHVAIAVPDLDAATSLRIGVAERFFWAGCDPGIAERVTEALRLIEASGASLKDQPLPGCDEVYRIYHQGGIVSAELYALRRRQS